MNLSFEEELLGMPPVLVHLALVEALHSLRHKAEIVGGTLNAPGPEDNGPVHINYGRSMMPYDRQQ